MNEIYLLGIIPILVLLWYFSNYNYFRITKVIRKTKNDVDNCVKDVTKLKEDIKHLKDIVTTIDDKISQIEKKIR